MDDDLLKRFNALRAPLDDPVDQPAQTASPLTPAQYTLRAAQAAQKEDDELAAIAEGRFSPSLSEPHHEVPSRSSNDDDDALQRRMRGLRGDDALWAAEKGPEREDDEVEAYLANLSNAQIPDEKPIAGPSISASKRLAREARAALKESEGFVGQEDLDAREEGDHDESDDEPFETEEVIIARALDEASLSEQHDQSGQVQEPQSTDQASAISNPKSPTTQPTDDDAFSFPSLPAHEPLVAEPEDDQLQKRMELLLGLKGPSVAPGAPKASGPVLPTVPKREVGQGWNLPGYNDSRDNDLDSWCCICNKDAELVCAGCDDDLYCTECWREGHEFEKHRVKKFVWGKKKLVGAA
ncbi:hypothetical protein DB88DRAFT_482389 [Papiliotrema laurentii]|uniref:Uncharacterized protein n=1 Tax=Papiliotrema laurentii TaxID=5418 RepID=A0AAD9FV29_PAPLA|nr:hypothetical protein DB88DRAFT_482389 [Papiliotrema laurentii]